jgi:hypothetical protein
VANKTIEEGGMSTTVVSYFLTFHPFLLKNRSLLTTVTKNKAGHQVTSSGARIERSSSEDGCLLGCSAV